LESVGLDIDDERLDKVNFSYPDNLIWLWSIYSILRFLLSGYVWAEGQGA
jgi:hypothetical protein